MEHGLRGGARLRAVRDHSRADRCCTLRRARAAAARRAVPAVSGVSAPRPRAACYARRSSLGAVADRCCRSSWMVAASFMPTGEATALPPRLVPSALDARALPRALHPPRPRARASRTALLLASAVTRSRVSLNSMAGYAFAKLRFAGRDRIFRAAARGAGHPRPGRHAAALPAAARARPGQHLLRRRSSRAWRASSASSWSASTRSSIPDSLLDAARIDGAGELRIYWSLVAAVLPADPGDARASSPSWARGTTSSGRSSC